MIMYYYDKINSVLKISISQLASVNIPQQTRPHFYAFQHFLLLHTRLQLNTPTTTINRDPLQIFKPARRDRGCRSGESDFPAVASERVGPLSMSQRFGLFDLAAGARTTSCLRVYHCYLCCFLFFTWSISISCSKK